MDIFAFLTKTVLLVICFTLVSGVVKAFFSLSVFQILQLKESENHSAKILSKLLDHSARFFATTLILKFIILFLFVWCMLQTMPESLQIYSKQWILLIIIALFFILELTISYFVRKNSMKYAQWMAYPMLLFVYILFPLSYIPALILGKKFDKQLTNISLDEISEVIENADMSSEQDQDEAQLLKGVVRFGDIEAKSIMKERITVTAIEKNMSFHKVLNILIESGYSRFPVYEEHLDNIIGVLVLKDLLPLMNDTKNSDWQSKIRPAFFVEETTKIDDILPTFRQKKNHFAIVVDEYGGTSGIITLEDILEEIVGEITDESDDVDEEQIGRKIDEQSWEFEANTSINDFCKVLDVNEDFFDAIKGESESLGGLVLALYGKFPEQNVEVSYRKINFRVLETDDRRITKLLVSTPLKNENNA